MATWSKNASTILSVSLGKHIQAFVDYAGSGGSHAGLTSAKEAWHRYRIALDIIDIGLDLLHEPIRVERVLSALTPAPADAGIEISCRTCGTSQFLSECEVKHDGNDTVYNCKNGCQQLVVISAPGDSPRTGRGYRFGNHVIRNASDLLLRVAGSANKVLIPALPAALVKSRPDTN